MKNFAKVLLLIVALAFMTGCYESVESIKGNRGSAYKVSVHTASNKFEKEFLVNYNDWVDVILSVKDKTSKGQRPTEGDAYEMERLRNNMGILIESNKISYDLLQMVFEKAQKLENI